MATTYNLSPVYQGPQFTNSGALLVGGKIYWYLAGTSTTATVYQNAAGSAAHTQPIILDARGEAPAPIYLASGSEYKAVLQDSNGSQLQVIDSIIGVGDSTFSNYSIGQLTIDSTSNGAKLFQGESGDLEILTNLNSGTSGLWKFKYSGMTFPDATVQTTAATPASILPATATTAEMQAGTQTATRTVSPALVASAISALAPVKYVKSANATSNSAYQVTGALPSTTYDSGFSCSITPASTSNKIIATVLANACSGPAGLVYIGLYRNGTQVSSAYTTNTNYPLTFTYIDSPSSTSSVTYSLRYWWSGSGSGTLTIGGGGAGVSILLLEVAA